MKRLILVFLISGIIGALSSAPAFAAWKKTGQQAATKTDADRAVKDLMRKQEMQRVTDLLNSKEWVVYLVPSGVSAGKRLPVITDTLTFKDGRVSSQHLTSKGYGSSNYTLTVYDGMSAWETMQRTEKDDLAFWRGEIRGDSLTGLMNLQSSKGVVEEYSFSMNAPVPQTQQGKKR